MFIGVVIAAIAGYLIKAKFGSFVRKLLENEIDSPEKAVTLDELGLKRTAFIKFGLRSHSNYKNLLVAITADGRFYANCEYTDMAPELEEQTVIKRKRRADVIKVSKESDSENDIPTSELAKLLQAKEHTTQTSETSEPDTISLRSDTDDSPENADSSASNEDPRYADIPKARVRFDVATAKYYIPAKVRARAYSLYYTRSAKHTVIPMIILLIVLALIATFSGKLISGFTEWLGSIENPFSHKTL